MKYKLLVLDLDGTLTNSKKEITENTKNKLIEAQKNGIIIVLASGRPTYGIVPLAEQLEIAKYGGFILSFNGGKIINWATKEIIYENDLSQKQIPLLYNYAKESGVEILSYDNEYIVSESDDNEYIKHESFLNKMNIKKVDSFLCVFNKDVPKCLIVGDKEILINLEKRMKNDLSDQMSIYRSEPFFLELMPLNIDKALSLEKLLLHLKIDKSQMIACGDGYNDLSMIRYAGLGIAMANAQPEVKEAADYITLSNEEDGVAAIVEQFLLQ